MRQNSSVSLKTLSHIQIGGTADQVYYPESIPELVELLQKNPQASLLGEGSNVYFAEKKYSLIICTKLLKEVRNESQSVIADCGAKLGELFGFAAGVPATVGGGVIMNFGAFNKEIKDYLLGVDIFDQAKGSVYLPMAELKFGYRWSSLHENKQIVLRAHFSNLDLSDKADCLAKRKEMPYYKYPNIGSIFKNPPGKSAGQLIDQCGLKGKVVGGLKISEHANIIINTGGGTAQDMEKLLAEIKAAVKTKFGETLKEEIECLK